MTASDIVFQDQRPGQRAMTSIQQDITTPALGCSPSDGLPRDCQGRHVEPRRSVGGAGMDASRVAVPGNFQNAAGPASQMFLSFVDLECTLIEMHQILLKRPADVSLKNFLINCQRLNENLRELEAEAKRCLVIDHSAYEPGYLGIPS